MKHKHAELIKLWADGAEVQRQAYFNADDWLDDANPTWREDTNFRVKPKLNKELLATMFFENVTDKTDSILAKVYQSGETRPNVKFTFDGETGEFLSVEKL